MLGLLFHREKPGATGSALILVIGIMGLLLGLLWLRHDIAPLVRAGTYRVPDDYPTIQAAIDAAAHGDIIQITEGIYTENLVITKSIILQGGWSSDFLIRSRKNYTTTIHGNRAGWVIFIGGVCTPTIEGFVITGGDATGLGGGPYGRTQDAGGGICTVNASPIIVNNTIIDNIGSTTRQGAGGGIMLYYPLAGPPVISGNLIISNVACLSDTQIGQGGGICVAYGKAIIVGNQVLHNVASDGEIGQGGGINLFNSNNITVYNNQIRSNVASRGQAGEGGGISLDSSKEIVIANNLVLANIAGAEGQGGGVSLFGSNGVTIEGNTVQGNIASNASGFGDGGGLWLSHGGSVIIRNNTVQGNIASAENYREGRAMPDHSLSPLPFATGGGIRAKNNDYVLIKNNAIRENIASIETWGYGGGIYSTGGDTRIENNIVESNRGGMNGPGYSGGIHLGTGTATVVSNLIVSNTATSNPLAPGDGGGLWIRHGHLFTLTNNVIARNHAPGWGSGIQVDGPSTSMLINNTVVDNGQMGGEGIGVGPYATLALTNNIIALHAVGLIATADSTITVNYTLWYSNDLNITSTGFIVENRSIYGHPCFADSIAGDYHLDTGSAAINAGDPVGVPPAPNVDIDGDARPIAGRVDIGADESYEHGAYHLYLPLAGTTTLLSSSTPGRNRR